jgi:hypothetical protein
MKTTPRVLATEGRFYQFVRGATADHADVQPFFASVALGKKQDGKYVSMWYQLEYNFNLY